MMKGAMTKALLVVVLASSAALWAAFYAKAIQPYGSNCKAVVELSGRYYDVHKLTMTCDGESFVVPNTERVVVVHPQIKEYRHYVKFKKTSGRI